MDWFQGTADAVRKHISNYRLADDDEVLILSGDHLYRMDFREILTVMRKKKAGFVVATVPVKREEVQEFGIMRIRSDGKITAFKEKPKTVERGDSYGGKYLASMGIYAFRAAVLKKMLKSNEGDFGREIIPNSLKKHRAYAYVFKGYWRDIGTIKNFYESSIELASPTPPFDFALPEARIYTRPRFLPPLLIDGATIKSSLLSEGCTIRKAEITKSIIGLRSVINNRTVIRNSVVMGADYYDGSKRRKIPLGIGERCLIEKAILDKNVSIGPGVKIVNKHTLETFDGDNYFIRDGIVVIPKNAVIKAGTII